MITIDSRVGSKELYPYFKPGTAELSTLDFGDFAFVGNGPDGVPWLIGIERKTASEITQMMTTGRLVGHQIPGLMASYNRVYLLIEGMVKYDLTNGVIKKRVGKGWVPLSFGRREVTVNAFLGYLNTISEVYGIRMLYTGSQRESVSVINALHHWWTAKEYDSHKSHLQQHRPHGLLVTKHSLMRRIAAELPGIGFEKSKEVETYFPDVRSMLTADVKEWTKIPGIGKGIAGKIVEALK